MDSLLLPRVEERPFDSTAHKETPAGRGNPFVRPRRFPRLLQFIVIYALGGVLLVAMVGTSDLHRFVPPLQLSIGSPPLEIRLSKDAIKTEGIGAVLSGIKGALLLSNYTGAALTMNDKSSGHGYNLKKYLRLGSPLWIHRIPCNLTKGISQILNSIVESCEQFDYSELESFGVFNNCNMVTVEKYLNHPRSCLKHTQDLVRDATNFRLPDNGMREDICVLRRGGDVENKILNEEGNMWAIDENKTIPILREASKRGRRIVLVTETSLQSQIEQIYQPHVFSNRESLDQVVSRISQCRCSFVASASSFAMAMMQITQPEYIVYTENRDGFSFETKPYAYEEYGPNAVSLLNGTEAIADLCAPLSDATRSVTEDQLDR